MLRLQDTYAQVRLIRIADRPEINGGWQNIGTPVPAGWAAGKIHLFASAVGHKTLAVSAITLGRV